MNTIYIGLISGTSADAIDAVAVTIDNNISQLTSLSYPIKPSLRNEIFAIQKKTISLVQFGELDTKLGGAFADAALALIEEKNLDKKSIQAIGSHGQTIKHHPSGPYPFTIQVGDPNIIAEKTKITTVADFRRRDIAAGGQGAPLVPAFHQAWLGAQKDTAILNMGGIANITILATQGAEPRLGFDTGPANTLIDAWTYKYLHKKFDHNGYWARSGVINEKLLTKLLNHSYFQKIPPKSVDISQFNLAWLEGFLPEFHGISPQDVAATIIQLSVASIQGALTKWANETTRVIACGGGCRNKYLMERLSACISPIQLTTTSMYGIHEDWVEATAFAWLARQTLLKKSGNVYRTTGASQPCILGGIYY